MESLSQLYGRAIFVIIRILFRYTDNPPELCMVLNIILWNVIKIQLFSGM